MRIICHEGLELIKAFEGFRSSPYQDSGKKWTIGYGHTEQVDANTNPITQIEAEQLLGQDLQQTETIIARFIQVDLNDNQYAALVSLVFNVGALPLSKELGQLLNQRDYSSAAEEFSKWIYASGRPLEGLERRRLAEKQLFLKPI